MEADGITLEVLKGIRSELGALRTGIKEQLGQLGADLGGRIDQTNERLDRLEKRQHETEIRLASELIEVVSAVTLVKELLPKGLDLRDQVAQHETRITLLETHFPQ